MKIGLIGTGFWADQCHAAAITARADLEFVGIWGRDAAKTAALAERRGTSAYETPEALFADVDVVSFAVPPTVESELAPIAADAGCHLLLEKPIAISVGAAGAVVDACDRNGVRSIVNFTNLIAGTSGAWMRDAVIGHDWDGGEVTILGSLRAAEDSPFFTPWRLQDDGALWDVGPHAVSMALAALGPVADVQAHHGRGDTYVLSLSHERGGVSTVTLSYGLPAGSGKFTAGFWGADGVTAVPDGPGASRAAAVATTLDELIAAIDSGDTIVWDAAFGASVTRVLADAEAAAAR
ncbi:MAG TPA: Gfo/Idh/MocA family oxidoreductase [Galbitalea sp.]|jgi:predicted dehydrogenase|nr:Gfo/Idh/MocA family oxidoreductase [Galbitalea sp.]